MTPVLNVLILLWLAITIGMLIMWIILRRRRSAAAAAAFETMHDADVPEPVPVERSQPVLVGAAAPVLSTAAASVAVPGPATAATSRRRTDIDQPLDTGMRTLFEMLEGIRLPYDLAPVSAIVEDPDRHLIFLTTHSNAEEVGTRFADDLIRLGYDFKPKGMDRGVASRGDEVISMMIVPRACHVDEENGPRYGAAAPGDVALELWIGRAPTAPPTGQ